jgi:hypothetical protein
MMSMVMSYLAYGQHSDSGHHLAINVNALH